MLSQARSTVPRLARAKPALRAQQLRFQSSSSASSGSSVSHISAGLAGGIIGSAIFYGVYSYTPAGRTASKINKAAVEANKQYKIAADKLQKNTPSADQAVDSIKQFAYTYVAWIPGGRAYVDAAFNDVNLIREKHKDEVDQIVNDAYKQLQDLSKSGLSMETASKTYDVVADLSKKIANLSGDAISDIIDNHPQFKEKLGGNVEKLKELGNQYGPEAKKQVDETWGQVKDIFAGGFSAASLAKAKKLIDEKVQQFQKLGDEAWKKGMDELKPYLEKSPKVKELIENNSDALKSGNVKELFEKAKSAVDSGDLSKLEEYVSKTAEQAKSKGSDIASDWGLEKYFNMIPQGSEIMPKIKELGEFAQQHKQDGERLLKETVEELKQVLEKKSKEAQKIVDSAKDKAKDTAADAKDKAKSK